MICRRGCRQVTRGMLLDGASVGTEDDVVGFDIVDKGGNGFEGTMGC